MGQDRSGSAAAPSGTEAGLHYLEGCAPRRLGGAGRYGRRRGRCGAVFSGAGLPASPARLSAVDGEVLSVSGDRDRRGQQGRPTYASVRPGGGWATPPGPAAGRRRRVLLRSPRGDGGALDRGAGEWTLRTRSDLPTWPGRTAVLAGGGLCLGALSSAGRCLGASGGRRLCSVWEPRLGAPYGGSYFCQSLGRRVKGRDVPARVPPLKPTPEAWKDPRGGAQAAQSRDLSAC